MRADNALYSATRMRPAWSLGLACAWWRTGSTGGRWQVPRGGSSQVDRGHEPCWQIAARSARHVMRRASCPRCPRTASLFAGIGPASGQWRDRGRTARTGPAVPVPGSPGNLWRGRERWPRRPGFQGGTVSGARPAGEYGHRLRQAGGSAACPAGSRTAAGQRDAAELSWT
jgi:hypothetical protein